MGCDTTARVSRRRNHYFNPRIPYGMRRLDYFPKLRVSYFNPRIPYGMRRAHITVEGLADISIHASRMGCDTGSCRNSRNYRHFNPRIPYGMRRDPLHADVRRFQISIHASRMGCDMWHNQLTFNQRISIHASRMGCDTRIRNSRSVPGYFNPRIPYGMRPTCNTWTH